MTTTTPTCFRLEVHERVAHLVMVRPEKRNAMNLEFWQELPKLIADVDTHARARAMVVSAEGPHFCSGLDLAMFMGIGHVDDTPHGRHQKPQAFMQLVTKMQDALSAFEKCRIPVVVAIQGGCIGGGVDFATACDLRYVSKDAFFTIEETNIGMTADVGTFPRICKLLPEAVVRELAYTGRRFTSEEALHYGLVNKVLENHGAAVEHALAVGAEIASKAPSAVYGCKRAISYARDHSTADALEHIGVWNASMLDTGQIMEAIQAKMEKRPGNFAELPPLVTPID